MFFINKIYNNNNSWFRLKRVLDKRVSVEKGLEEIRRHCKTTVKKVIIGYRVNKGRSLLDYKKERYVVYLLKHYNTT